MNVLVYDQLQFLKQLVLKQHSITAKLLCMNSILAFNNSKDIILSLNDFEVLSQPESFLYINTNDLVRIIDSNCVEETELSDEIVPVCSLPDDFDANVKKIVDVAAKNDKMAWWRLNREINSHVTKLEQMNVEFFTYQQELSEANKALYDKYEEVIVERNHLLQHIDDIRTKMVAECIHPVDEITYKDGHYICKFCNAKLVVQD